MVEVVSLVHFGNPLRATYLERSFASFHHFNKNVRHLVFDSTPTLDVQMPYYKRFNVEVRHMPGTTYGERMRKVAENVKSDYFVFLPDDFEWVFSFPLEDCIQQARRHGIAELKLTCRGHEWFSQNNSTPKPWFEGRRVVSGETLVPADDLLISKRRWIKDFHEQFSLACNLMNRDFFKWVADRTPLTSRSPGQAEKNAYLRLLVKRYLVAYYKMWIPAFHFIDLKVEGDTELNRLKLSQNITPENTAVYNRLYNSDRSAGE